MNGLILLFSIYYDYADDWHYFDIHYHPFAVRNQWWRLPLETQWLRLATTTLYYKHIYYTRYSLFYNYLSILLLKDYCMQVHLISMLWIIVGIYVPFTCAHLQSYTYTLYWLIWFACLFEWNSANWTSTYIYIVVNADRETY